MTPFFMSRGNSIWLVDRLRPRFISFPFNPNTVWGSRTDSNKASSDGPHTSSRIQPANDTLIASTQPEPVLWMFYELSFRRGVEQDVDQGSHGIA